MDSGDGVTLNPYAVNAPFPTKDQLLALIGRRKEVLELMGDDQTALWQDDPNHQLRTHLRAVTAEENKVDKQLKAASAVLQRDFGLSHD